MTAALGKCLQFIEYAAGFMSLQVIRYGSLLCTDTEKDVKRDENFYGRERSACWLEGEERLLRKERTAYFSVVLWLQSVYTSEVCCRHASDFVPECSSRKGFNHCF